jgi:hypothetical protein
MQNVLKPDDIFQKNLVVILFGFVAIYFLFFSKSCSGREQFSTLSKNAKIDTIKCSKACCFQQYPVPFNVVVDPNIPNPSIYERSNYMCNNGSGSGCCCITKKQKNWLGSRAGNTSFFK